MRAPGKSVRAHMARIGRKGGRSGRGAAKRRGDADYYRRIRGRSKDKDHENRGARLEALAVALEQSHDHPPLIRIDTPPPCLVCGAYGGHDPGCMAASACPTCGCPMDEHGAQASGEAWCETHTQGCGWMARERA